MIKTKVLALMMALCMVSVLSLYSHNLGMREMHAYDWGHYNSDRSPNFRNNPKQNNWLSRVPDSTRVNKLSIPGTHDSGTYACNWDQFCDESQCQSWSLKDQLDSGIRYFDLRVKFQSNYKKTLNQLMLAHNRFTFHRLTDELRVIKTWLDQNSREFVILQFQQEYTSINQWQAGDKIKQALNSVGFTNLVASFSPPTVGQLRRKAWIIEAAGVSFANVFYTFHLPTGSQGVSQGNGYYIENDYSITVGEIKRKVSQVRDGLQRQCRDGQLKVTFLSASGGVQPYWLARNDGYPNQNTLVWLRSNRGRKCLGVALMDYPGSELIKRIIDTNF